MAVKLSQIIREWEEKRRNIKILESEVKIHRTKIITAMDKRNASEIKNGNTIITKRTQLRESVSKKNLPSDIWDKYKTNSEFTVLTVKIKKQGEIYT
jgi:hypothetical protein